MAQTNPMKKNTACTVVFPIYDADGDLVTAAAALDSERSIDGGAFSDCTSEATEIATASGMYYLNLTAAETNGDVIAVIVKTTTSGAKTTALVFYTAAQTFDNLDTIVDALTVSAAAIKAKTDNLPSGIQKNVALAKFEFAMVLAADHLTPATGKAITATISQDGGAFGACANAAVEVSSGFYYIDLTAAEMNAKVISLIFTAAACDQRSLTLITST